jgi:hypothetical protein
MSAEELKKLSLNDKQISECLKKSKLTQILVEVIEHTGITSADKATGALLLNLAQTEAKEPEYNQKRTNYIASAIGDQRLKSTAQLDGKRTVYVQGDHNSSISCH